MRSGITIRPATVADIPHLVHHRRAMFEAMGEGDMASLGEMVKSSEEYFRKSVADGSYRGFLAVNEADEVVGGGGIVICFWPASPHQPQPRRALILNMYTEPQWRRCGIARSLMEAMIEWCRREGFSHVDLHASSDGRPLYEQLGFRPTNELRLQLK